MSIASQTFKDTYAGTEDDSGFTLMMPCRTCGETHRVALDKGGRMHYECGGLIHRGQMREALPSRLTN